MKDFKSFKETIFNIDNRNFEHQALELFRFQAENNHNYRHYIQLLGINPDKVNSVNNIPFLPISQFRERTVKTGNWNEELIFKSSGTTGENRSSHYIESLDYYHRVSLSIFEHFYGNISDLIILALLPSYIEQGSSSLVDMVQNLIKKSGHSESGFYLHNHDELIHTLNVQNSDTGKKTILWGVTYALLDLAENHEMKLKNTIILETGGMKGRREELIREEVHEILIKKFGVNQIHSEYGMTELLSQSYSSGNGVFKSPEWLKILLRDINDPYHLNNELSYGGVNIIDLANVHSCAFIETGDLGRFTEDANFEIIGRFDNSDVRGCNLLLN
jgi:phenylacetate-coenzyme A ligase PaaK-like adenylate-forming protein